MAQVTGTLTAVGDRSNSLYLRVGEQVTVNVSRSGSGSWTAQLVRVIGAPPAKVEIIETFQDTATGFTYRNTSLVNEYIAVQLREIGVGASVSYTVADVAGDQILQEWRAADGTLAFRITDQGPVGGQAGPTFDVRAFGAVGDGVTDDTAAIQRAVNAATSANRTVVAVGTFRLAGKLILSCDADFTNAQFNVPGASVPVAIEVSTGAADPPTNNLVSKVIKFGRVWNADKVIGAGWAGLGVGIRIINAITCEVHTGWVRGFAVGVDLAGNSEGTAYNNVYVGYLENNQVNLRLRPLNATGYVNENQFIGGRYHYRNEEGTNVPGTRHIQLYPFDVTNAGTSWPNNNVFLKPSVEGDVPEYHIEIGGNNNTVLNGRFETFGGVPNPKVLFTGHASNNTKNLRNLIVGGWNADNIAFTTTGVGLWGDLITPRKNLHSGFGVNDVVRNTAGNTRTEPVRRVYPAAKNILGAEVADTDWTVNEYATGFEAKATGDDAPRIWLDYATGRVYFGRGGTTPTIFLQETAADPGALSLNDDFWPTTDDAYWLGQSGRRWQRVYVKEAYVTNEIYFGTTFTGVPSIRTYDASPEGNVTAPVGSIVLRTNGGAGTTLYVKESGAGNTGWVAK